MLKRAARHEAIARIRDRVDAEDKRQFELDTDPKISNIAVNDPSHVLLGSPGSPHMAV